MSSSSLKKLGCVALVILAGVSGCQQGELRAPLGTSISGMTFETAPKRGPLFSHSQLTSLTGMFPLPDVGLMVYYSVASDPTTSIGISRDHSFKLVGTVVSERANLSTVVGLRNDLSKVQVKAAEAVAVASGTVTFQAKIKELRASKKTVPDSATAEVRKAIEDENSLIDSKIKGLTAEVDVLKEKRQKLDAEIAKLELDIQEKSSAAGVIIARWETDSESQTGLALGRYAKAGGTSSRKLGGFIVLAGLRADMLFFGDDFYQLFQYIAERDTAQAQRGKAGTFEGAMLSQVSFPTYQLQAQNVAYVESLDVSQAFNVDLTFKVEDLYGIGIKDLVNDQLALNYYSARVASLGNRGVIGGIKWEKQAFCWLAGSDLDGAQGTLDGWQTIVSQSTSLNEAMTKNIMDRIASWRHPGDPQDPKRNKRSACTSDQCGLYKHINRDGLGGGRAE